MVPSPKRMPLPWCTRGPGPGRHRAVSIAACAREQAGSHAAALRLEACLTLQSIVAASSGCKDAAALAHFAQLLVQQCTSS